MFVAVVLVGLGITAVTGLTDQRAGVGERAPDFEVELFDGGTFLLSRHLAEDGRPVVLNLWASWCIPCRVEMPILSEFAAANPHILVLGVAVKNVPGKAEEFAAEISPSYPVAHGNDQFLRSYWQVGLPLTYFIDPEGIIVDQLNGPLPPEMLADFADSY